MINYLPITIGMCRVDTEKEIIDVDNFLTKFFELIIW